MTGFTFKYPVFEGWEVNNLYQKLTGVNDVCVIKLNYPNTIDFEKAPQIIVTKRARDPKVDFEIPTEAVSKPPNPNNIPYIYTEDSARDNYTIFYIPGFKIYIELGSHSDEHGFNKYAFWKTVIESFRMEK